MVNWIEVSPDWTIGLAAQVLWMIAGVLAGVVGLALLIAIVSAVRDEMAGTFLHGSEPRAAKMPPVQKPVEALEPMLISAAEF
jgi:hypothetical protein